MNKDRVHITSLSDFGMIIEDPSLYQITVSWDEAVDLYEKLSIALSLPKELLPLGSSMHPSCVIEEFIQSKK